MNPADRAPPYYPIALLQPWKRAADALVRTISRGGHALAAIAQPPKEEPPDPWRAAPWRAAPWNQGRANHAHFGLIALLLVLINYAAVVLYPLGAAKVCRGDARGCLIAPAQLVVFHVPLLLAVASWVATCTTDPGSAEVEWWQRYMLKQQPSPERCRKSGLVKPPRSHFDSVTRRLTLNMDHFCPWVVNTVGFYNKKFFILFLFYLNISLGYTLFILGCLIYGTYCCVDTPRFFRMPQTWVLLSITAFDGLLFCLLCIFFVWHIMMVVRNQTTIEAKEPHYDIGCCANIRQVFGSNPWTWFLPCYFDGPEGDGLRWPTRSATMPVML
ncbi:hypothetical protein AB1Y20_005992 [Prymnesium parvum]|uniref:Palmitoyltransferase n=1 Tax=Prymnesium parvum TaxID=97485 RepID=A0AB34J3P5_PRYPA